MNIAYIPNCITALRLVGTFILVFTKPFTLWFYILDFFTGVTDVLDGYLARKLKVSSEFGARLDSVADLAFNLTMIIKILPAVIVILPSVIWYAVALIACFRVASYVIAAVKFRKMASLHTVLNKICGFLVFTVPFFVHTRIIVPLCFLICILGIMASIEELFIHLTKNEYSTNVKTIVK